MTEVPARLRVIVPDELAAGFEIAGATVHGQRDAAGAESVVSELVGEGERGVIAVYDPWFTSFPRSARERLEQSVAPVVVRIPSGLGLEGERARRAQLARLLQRAVGYRISFEEGE